MICEYCKKEHDGSYSSGRFCSEGCARRFSTWDKREDINQRVSKKLKGKLYPRREHIWTEEERRRHSETLKASWWKRYSGKKFETLGKMAQKGWLLKLQNNKCAKCKNEFVWLGKPLMKELHHKDGNDENRTLENSELLCPNCHSITDNYMFKNRHHSKEAKNKMSNALKQNQKDLGS